MLLRGLELAVELERPRLSSKELRKLQVRQLSASSSGLLMIFVEVESYWLDVVDLSIC